ncbi:aspartyl-phosphate phosphatase Spo0E family protein [Pseudogracilibacillus sp. SE30717A]|uniref:aspartyl-phosphate phosphatase Spo0E family protein n=1 Tax=Pseudogracilibacillus sp. SE30717A TaxID=3098293 RepID=UPI00300E685E
MYNQLENLSNEIERLREKINDLVEAKGPTHSQVIEMNQKLDVVLNEYDRLKKSKS